MNTVAAGALLPLPGASLFSKASSAAPDKLKIYVFSKHLRFLNYRELAGIAAELGFDGVDLTVRPKGHVEPERVADDLPRAVEEFRKAGLGPFMMTTVVDDPNNQGQQTVLKVAASLGLGSYRMNWFPYPPGRSMTDTIADYATRIKQLSALNRQLGITGCYQNHSGLLVGASIWELWQILKDADQGFMGAQYDIRHATVEGGLSWQNGLRLIHPVIKTLAVKDCKWIQKDGKWTVEDTPIGEGMIDFKSYFRLLKQYKVQVPVSLHFEYPLGGAEKENTVISIDRKVIFEAMKRDLAKVHQLWNEASV